MSSLSLSSPPEENQFAIDKELYDSTLAIRDEMNLIAERVQKMDEHKGSVSEAVYIKVKSDYLANYEKIKKNFEDKKQEIHLALQNLYKGKKEQESELKKHQDVLEEAKFRNFLGEFSDKKFKEIENRETTEVKRYENLLSIIDANIKQYEDLIGGPVPQLQNPAETEESTKPKLKIPLVDESVSVAKHKMDEAPSSFVSAELSVAESAAEEAYILESEGDYFQNDAADELPAAENKAPSSDSLPKLKTKKIPPASEKIEEGPTNKQNIKTKTEKSKGGLGFDDSISSILKSIPMDEPEAEIPDEAAEPLVPEEVFENPEPEVDTGDMIEDAVIPSPESGKAKVVCIEGDLASSEFELDDNTSIGRSPSNDIVLKEPKVSRQHAAINKIDGSFVVVDLKSSNGVFVNGRKVEEVVLEDGDEILIGNTKMIFHAGE